MLSYKKTYTLPFKFNIPNYTKYYLKKRSILRLFKFVKRSIFIFIKRQHRREIFKISKKHKNILWVNFSAPSLGDSLMDLSSRVLLYDKKVDLLTDKKNAHLFHNDLSFASVFSDKKDVINKSYDLVIVDSYSTKSVKIKTAVARSVPFVGLYGYYNGPEVNRVLFSFHQINNLLGYLHSESEINKRAKNSISISIDDKELIDSLNLPKHFIAIVIGGEWEFRTYNYWGAVIAKLLSINKNLNVILLGSENAIKDTNEILETFPIKNLLSYVAKFTFNQTAQIISQADFLFCCDGGLMHAANALDTKIIPLFARLDPEMQLTKSCKAFPLFDATDVNNISVDNIIMTYCKAISLDHNHLPSE